MTRLDGDKYSRFLARKSVCAEQSGIATPGPVHASLYKYQSALVRWALARGRAAIFADCGLGKTRMQIEWLRQSTDVDIAGPGRGLIVCPLAVAEQTIGEANEIGATVTWADDSASLRGGMFITNYEKLHRFDPSEFDAIVLDESSILKSIDGKTRTKLIKEFSPIPRKLCCTATPAPNDIAEMANHAEFLGVMSRVEMLATFFVHDQDGWRLKGHAVEPFYDWMTTWAMFVRVPGDIGFPEEDDEFTLPPIEYIEHVVDTDYRPDGQLFAAKLSGVTERSRVRKDTIDGRAQKLVDVIAESPREQWVVWCGLNDEGRKIKELMGDDCVLIEGSDGSAVRLERHRRWVDGDVRVLVSKPAIFGWGMNWQHCARVAFMGLGDSYEQYYQAIRRCWRFGQLRPVASHVVVSSAEIGVVQNIKRKEADAESMAAEIISRVRDIETMEIRGMERETDEYKTGAAHGRDWTLMLGDSCERLADVETGSVGLSVFSPPFASLYTYSNSERDLGNSPDYGSFFDHFRFIIDELLRVSMPCRRACVHVQQVTTTKATHGKIGWRDFRADTVRAFVDAGWIYDGEVVIDKDPQAQAIRTKSKALMFVQKNKDSAWSRPAMADYVLLFRAPGENAEPIKNDVSNEEWIKWARPIWYDIRETETLNARAGTQAKDERHICPLQLETIERCVRLWSNPGDLVLSPFAGIGSEGYEAVKRGRRFVGIELKESYWRAAVTNLRDAESCRGGDLFSGVHDDGPVEGEAAQ